MKLKITFRDATMETKVSKINVVASSACVFNSTEVPQIRSSVEFLKKL